MTKEKVRQLANCLKNNYTIDYDDMSDFCDTVMALAAGEKEVCEINIQDVTGTRERFHDVESYEVGEELVNIYFKNGDEIIYFKDKVVLIEIIRDPEIMSKWKSRT